MTHNCHHKDKKHLIKYNFFLTRSHETHDTLTQYKLFFSFFLLETFTYSYFNWLSYRHSFIYTYIAIQKQKNSQISVRLITGGRSSIN